MYVLGSRYLRFSNTDTLPLTTTHTTNEIIPHFRVDGVRETKDGHDH